MLQSSLLRLTALLLVPLLLLPGGCGRQQEAGLSPVSGKVSYRGQPVRMGKIVFAPDPARGGNGPLVLADIQPDGTYRLKTGEAPGVLPGCYRVTVSAIDAPPLPGQKFGAPRSLLPDRYRDPDLSGLGCEVQPGRENAFNFNLE